MIAVSCGIKISAVRHLVLLQSTRVTDRQTITTPKTALAYARAVKNGRLNLYDAEHSKCNHMMRLGFKGLKVA